MSAYAVSDAQPLNILWERIRDLHLDPAVDLGVSEQEPWNERSRRVHEAEGALLKALSSESSRLHFVDSRGEHTLHGPHLFLSDQLNRHATFVTGTYISFERPGPSREYLDQKLWVKNVDADVIVRGIELELRGKTKGSAISHVRSTGVAELECEKWLLARFAEPGSCVSKAQLRPLALQHFGSRLSGAGFKRVWDKVAPPERRTAGRKKG